MQPSDDEIRAMLAGATPGPWRVDQHMGTLSYVRAGNSHLVASASWRYGQEIVPAMGNARLIAAAPDIAALALSRGDALAKAEAENARLRDALAQIADSKRLPSYGDPAVLRGAALAALGGDDA